MKEIDFINDRMNHKEVEIPSYLYKYRPFDEYTFEMLDNNYVYLCPAERLDDPSECKIDFSSEDLYDLQTNRLTARCVNIILDYVRPHITDADFQKFKHMIEQKADSDGLIHGPDLLEAYFRMQGLIPEEMLVPLINILNNLSEKLYTEDVKNGFHNVFSLAYNARRDMGICSLSELKENNEMWQKYANDAMGYCIEYKMSGYENQSLLYPVVYQDDRETNIVTNILGTFIGQMIFAISGGQLSADKSQFMRLFLTKNSFWSYQKEWRLMGDANTKLTAPSINAIYLGKKVLQKGREQMAQYCAKHNIKLFESDLS